MQIETIGKYRLHLLAHEMQGPSWDPFVTVLRFDDEAQDFVCELEKHQVGAGCASYEAAIEAARRAGTAYIRSGHADETVGSKTN